MKNYKIKLTYKAIDDIEGIDTYISIDLNSPSSANKVVGKLRESISSLTTMPERHKKVEHPSVEDLNIRLFTVGSFVIIYKVDNNDSVVTILRVVSTKIDYYRLLDDLI